MTPGEAEWRCDTGGGGVAEWRIDTGRGGVAL